ncbi:MAG: hypothetical protein ACYDBJ_23745 [Aggregatilineales bacterium]
MTGAPAFALLIGLGIVAISYILTKSLKPLQLYWFEGLTAIVGAASLGFYLLVYVPEGQFLSEVPNWASTSVAHDMIDAIDAGRQVFLIGKWPTGVEQTNIVKYLTLGKPYTYVDDQVSITTGLQGNWNLNQPSAIFIAAPRYAEWQSFAAQLPKTTIFSVREINSMSFNDTQQSLYYEVDTN